MDTLLVKSLVDPPGLRGRIFQDAVSASGVALTQHEDSLETPRATDLWCFMGDLVRATQSVLDHFWGAPNPCGNRALICSQLW